MAEISAGGERVSRDAIERTGRDWREQVQRDTGKDPGAGAAQKRVRDAIIKQEQRNQRKER